MPTPAARPPGLHADRRPPEPHRERAKTIGADRKDPRAPAGPRPEDSDTARAYRWLLAASVVLNLAIVWLLEVQPAQDLPQHLAYARIFMDFESNAEYQRYYQLPEHFQPYFTVYTVLAWLGHRLGLLNAFKLLLSLYTVGFLLSFHTLVQEVVASTRPSDPDAARSHGPSWAGLLGTLGVWGPTYCMGFMPFVACIPILLMAIALLLMWDRGSSSAASPRPFPARPAQPGIALAGSLICAALLVSIHPVAAGLLVLIALLHATLNPSVRRWVAAVALTASCTLTGLVWNSTGQLGLGTMPRIPVDDVIRGTLGLEFINILLDINWGGPVVKLSTVLWHVLGPYRLTGQLIVAAGLLAVLTVVLLRGPRPTPSEPDCGLSTFRRTAVAFAVTSWFAPWSLRVPTEVTFLDFRMLGIAYLLLLACLHPVRMNARPVRIAIAVLALSYSVHFGVRGWLFQDEAGPALELLDQATPRGMMSSVSYNNRSAHFGKQFRVTHFLPMYYTARSGGLNTQFWAAYTDHLPIDYRPGKRPAQVPDWRPAEFTTDLLKGSDYLLLEAPDAGNADLDRRAYRRTLGLLHGHADALRCIDRWCLYRVR